MKLLFLVFYTVVSTHRNPCPDSWSLYGTCAVNHGFRTDTSKVEVLTTDPERVRSILKDYPGAIVDTFLISKAPYQPMQNVPACKN